MYDQIGVAPRNHLLQSLPINDLARLQPLLEPVELPHGMVLTKPDEPIEYVYFPETAMISIVAYSEAGQGAEVSVIGPEGAACLAVLLGADTTPYETMVQLAGEGYRVPRAKIRREFDENKALRDVLLRFVQRLHMQVSQTVLCNRLHSVEERLSKWLLMCHDRNASDSIRVTQEFVAVMLGSSRTSVTLTAIELQKNGLIAYERGKITIRDRTSLEDYACGCYKVIHDAYAN